MKKIFPTLTESQFKRGCSVALQKYRVKEPLADAVPRKLIVIELAKETHQERETMEEKQEEDVEAINDLSQTTKDLKHSCKHCGKQFIRLQNLANHVGKRHGEILPQFKCPDCDKSYTSKRALKVHKKNKHDEYQQCMCD